MNTRDLFELASLDVLGLLDDQERAAFEEAFRASPPAIQAQVRREQVRFTRSEAQDMLPDVDAPAGLRAKVIAAVREAIAAVRTEPVGRIGPGVAMAGFNSAPIWRAACIGFATASLVLAGFGFKVSRDNRAIAEGAQGISIMENLVRYADARVPRLLANPRTQRVSFAPAAPDVSEKVVAQMYIDADRKTAYIFYDNLPASSGTYKVVLRAANGVDAKFLKEFEATPGVNVVTVEVVGVESLNGMEILAPGGPQSEPKPLLVAREV